MKTAIITGIHGQDGRYMNRLLQKAGFTVVGLVRPGTLNEGREPPTILENVHLLEWDLAEQTELEILLREVQPDHFYNFAAFASGSGMFDQPVSIGDINGLAVARILEAIRKVDPRIRFCQASSSEMFGEPIASPQREETPFNPRSPYGAAKLYAHTMVRIYRQRYDLFACSAILFNHESPLRPDGFVSRKVSQAAASIKLGLQSEFSIGNLDARRDWGFAGDYVRAMWMMLEASAPDDFVIATGRSHSVRDLCEYAFSCVGLDYRGFVRVDSSVFRSDKALPLIGDPSKAREQLGWVAELSFPELIRMMVEADLKRLGGDHNVVS